MPNANRTQTVYMNTGNPDTAIDLVPYTPGQAGQAFDWNDRAYQIVNVDSGATASTPAGLPVVNQLAYWKDRSNYVVTNDSRFGLLGGVANSFRNNVAGVFRQTLTAAQVAGSSTSSPYGAQICLLQRGRSINVLEAGSGTAGELLVSDTSSTAAQALGVAINTAAPAQNLGVIVTATAGGFCVADVDIPNIP